MVAVAQNANRECIVDSVTATFQRCGTDVITAGVPMVVDVPSPNGISFSIDRTELAPLNDGASAAPFDKPTSSAFRVSVFYDDGSEVTGYAPESGVLYSTTADASCGSVNNAANTLAIVAGATCTSITVNVTVTIGSSTFESSDTAGVTRLYKVATYIDAYPCCAKDIASFHPLPCMSDTYERGLLRTEGTLETNETGDLTQYMKYASSSPSVAAPLESLVVPNASGTAWMGRADELQIPGKNTTGVSVVAVSVVVDSEARSSAAMASDWSLVEGSTVSLEAYGTQTTQFELSYSEGNSLLFKYPMFTTDYAWFDSSRVLRFNSSDESYIAIDSTGTLTQLANSYRKTTLTASLVCTADAWTRSVWSNLAPAEEDVDMGTSPGNAGAPYYFTSGTTMQIHVWSRPKTGQYLRATQIRVTLPTGMTSSGAAFEANSALNYFVSASFNVEGPRIMGLTATQPAIVPIQGKVCLGYFTVRVEGSGLLAGSLSVGVVSIQSDTQAADGADGNERSTRSDFESTASLSRVYIGTNPARRLLNDRVTWRSPLPAPEPPGVYGLRRRVQTACDPCEFKLFGDVNGDCEFNVNDVSAAQTFATRYSGFATGAETTNPLDTWRDDLHCSWVKKQLNPTLNLLDSSFGGDDPNDARHGQPDINSQDVIHLSRASQYSYRFLELSASCVGSSGLLLVAKPYGGVGQDKARVISNESSASVGTDVYFEIITATDQSFNVSYGTQLTHYENPYLLYGAASNVTIQPGVYTRVSGPQTGLLVKAEYSDQRGGYVAQLQPSHGGNVSYYVAVAVEVKMDGTIRAEQIQAFMGLSTFPYGDGGAGFSFDPLIGSPYSVHSQDAITCASPQQAPSPPPPETTLRPSLPVGAPPVVTIKLDMCGAAYNRTYYGRTCISINSGFFIIFLGLQYTKTSNFTGDDTTTSSKDLFDLSPKLAEFATLNDYYEEGIVLSARKTFQENLVYDNAPRTDDMHGEFLLAAKFGVRCARHVHTLAQTHCLHSRL